MGKRLLLVAFLGIAGLGAAGLAVTGCEADKVDALMGARCTGEDSCTVRCLAPGDDYPGGMCTDVCTRDGECPSDGRCVERLGGVCLFSCRDDGDCDFLGEVGGRRWTCQEQAAAGVADGGVGAGVTVCLGSEL